MEPAIRMLSSAVISVVLGVVSPLIAFWLSASTVVAVGTVFSWAENPFAIGVGLWWVITALACSLPIAAIARRRAPWFGFIAAVIVATMAFMATQPFHGTTSMSESSFAIVAVVALIAFPAASYFWGRMLSKWRGGT